MNALRPTQHHMGRRAFTHDYSLPGIYHPSTERINSCAAGRLLLVTPWQYQYRGKNEQVTVPFCKTMNCVAQALCRTKDTWWKEAAPNDAVPSGFPAGTTPEQKRNNKTQDK